MSSPLFRHAALVTRVTAGLCAGASLSLFGIVIAKVFDERFPAVEPGVTVLPSVAVSDGATFRLLFQASVTCFASPVYIKSSSPCKG